MNPYTCTCGSTHFQIIDGLHLVCAMCHQIFHIQISNRLDRLIETSTEFEQGKKENPAELRDPLEKGKKNDPQT